MKHIWPGLGFKQNPFVPKLGVDWLESFVREIGISSWLRTLIRSTLLSFAQPINL